MEPMHLQTKGDRAKVLPGMSTVSITPVTPVPTTAGPSQYSGKTLQEKLAEKQKQLSSQHVDGRKDRYSGSGPSPLLLTKQIAVSKVDVHKESRMSEPVLKLDNLII